MLFNTEEKNMMMGAFTAGGLSAILDGYFGYRLAGGVNIANTPTDPAYWLYANINMWVPNLSELIPWFGVPGLLYYVGKRKHSSKLAAMGLGGLVYGLSALVGTYTFRLAATATGQSATYRVVEGR